MSAGLLVVGGYFFALGVLSLYGLHRLHTMWCVFRTREHTIPRPTHGQYPSVTVQLPIYNERDVVERLVDAACQLDWPLDRLDHVVFVLRTAGTREQRCRNERSPMTG